MIVPTRRFWWLLSGGIFLGGIAYQLGSPQILLFYNVLIALAAVVTAKLGPKASHLRITRTFDPVLSVRVPNKILLTIENDGLETISGRMRDEAPRRSSATANEFNFSIGPGRIFEKVIHVTPTERGSDFFRGTYVRINCPLGIVQKQARITSEQPVRIYPNVLALKEFDLLKQNGRLNQIGIRKSRIKGLGTEFESLREYAVGDDYRKLDWKASARKGSLVVREFEREKNQSVIICLDVGRRMLAEVEGVTKLDHVLNSCLMLAHAVASAGDLIGLLVYSDHVKRFIPPKKGRSQVGAIIEALHDLTAEPVETDSVAAFSYLGARFKRRALVVNFTDADNAEEATELAKAFGALTRRHITLAVRVADPNLKEVAQASIHSAEDLYMKAAALTFAEDRVKAATVLTTQNIHQFESEPQDLASDLVSFYFMVKERSLL